MRSDRRHAACVGAPGWSGRTALLLGVAGATIGGMLLGAGPAHATAGRNPHPALGTIPGAVQLNPAAGPTSSRPTWATTHACSTGFRGSAVFREVHRNGKTTIAPGTVNLTVRGPSAAGMLNPVTVSDTRNTYPGWSVSGQATPFAGSGTAAGSTISGDQLGWTPTESALAGGVTLGPAVVPGDPGLGATPTVLASARAGSGFGASDLGATLMLAIPSAAKVGPYASTLTLTAVTSLP